MESTQPNDKCKLCDQRIRELEKSNAVVIQQIDTLEKSVSISEEIGCNIRGRLIVVEERLEGHVDYTEKSINKTEMQLNTRLEAMNEFRGQMGDQIKTYLTKDTYDANHRILEVKIEAVQKFMWISIGGLLVIQVLVGFIEKFFHSSL